MKVLAESQYPFVVSTKNKLIVEEPYFSLICKCNCVVQFRTEKIDEYLAMMNAKFGTRIERSNVTYVDAFNLYKGFKYENTHIQEYCGITFHPRYEAKTFLWLKNHRELMNKDTLMWITGADFKIMHPTADKVRI